MLPQPSVTAQLEATSMNIFQQGKAFQALHLKSPPKSTESTSCEWASSKKTIAMSRLSRQSARKSMSQPIALESFFYDNLNAFSIERNENIISDIRYD